MARNAKRTRNLLASLAVLTPLAGIYLLPPDTSLAEVRAAGVLRACVPPSYPPLVTGDEMAPGIEIELLQAVAQTLGLRLATSIEPAMGRDFNPRNWRLTRAQCAIIAGGVIGSDTTRGFLEITPAHAETGWALVAPDSFVHLEGQRVGVLATTGLDRTAVASYLRARHVEAVIVASASELIDGLQQARFAAAVTERLLAETFALPAGWHADWLAPELGRAPIVFGLWKGDLTLKRAVAAGLERLDREGVTSRIRARYQARSLAQDDAGEQILRRAEQASHHAGPGERQHDEAGS